MKKEIQIHRIETRDSSNILTTTMGAFKYSEIRFKPDVNFNAHHLYATVSQEIEPIKVGDRCYHPETNSIRQVCSDAEVHKYTKVEREICTVSAANLYHRKIIATTDKKLTVTKSATGYTETRSRTFTSTKPITGVQQSFIKEYCDKGGIDKALVEYDRLVMAHEPFRGTQGYQLKLNSDNTITIYPLEEKV